MLPIISIPNVNRSKKFRSFLALRTLSSFKASFKRISCDFDIFLPKVRNKEMENVIIPRPPSWIKIKIMLLPKKVKPSGVLRTISPVTQVADVAVKRAFTRERGEPSGVEAGSISRKVPASIAMIKPKMRAAAGLLAIEKIMAKFYYIKK